MCWRIQRPSLDGKIESLGKAREVVEEAHRQSQLNDLGIAVIAAYFPECAVVDAAKLRREFIAYLRANLCSMGGRLSCPLRLRRGWTCHRRSNAADARHERRGTDWNSTGPHARPCPTSLPVGQGRHREKS